MEQKLSNDAKAVLKAILEWNDNPPGDCYHYIVLTGTNYHSVRDALQRAEDIITRYRVMNTHLCPLSDTKALKKLHQIVALNEKCNPLWGQIQTKLTE